MVLLGVDAEYDQAISDIQAVEQALRDYLDQQKKVLGCRVSSLVVLFNCLEWFQYGK